MGACGGPACRGPAMNTDHEVLAAVLQIRGGSLQVLAWRRAMPPDAGRWALPGGRLRDDEDVETSVLRQLAEKVDVREVAHVEQISVFSAPARVPGVRTIATAFLGLVPSDADPRRPGRHGVAPARRPAGHRVRPRHHPGRGPRPAPRQALLHQPRLRTRTPRVHDLRAARAVRGGAGPHRVGHEPAARATRGARCWSRPARSHRPVRRAAARPPCSGSPTTRYG